MDYVRSRYRPFHSPRVGQRPPFPERPPVEQTPLGETQPLGPSLEELLFRARVPWQGTPVLFPRPSPLGPPPRGDGGNLIQPIRVPPPVPEDPSTLRSVGEFLLLTSPAWGSFLLTRFMAR